MPSFRWKLLDEAISQMETTHSKQPIEAKAPEPTLLGLPPELREKIFESALWHEVTATT